jgi:hypothetical protein
MHLLKPNLAVKQNFSLPKVLKTVFLKGKKACVTHRRPHPTPSVSRIEWPLRFRSALFTIDDGFGGTLPLQNFNTSSQY